MQAEECWGASSFSTSFPAVEPVENALAGVFSLPSPEVQAEFSTLVPAMSSSFPTPAASSPSSSSSSCSCSTPKLLPLPLPSLMTLLQALALPMLRPS